MSITICIKTLKEQIKCVHTFFKTLLLTVLTPAFYDLMVLPRSLISTFYLIFPIFFYLFSFKCFKCTSPWVMILVFIFPIQSLKLIFLRVVADGQPSTRSVWSSYLYHAKGECYSIHTNCNEREKETKRKKTTRAQTDLILRKQLFRR